MLSYDQCRDGGVLASVNVWPRKVVSLQCPCCLETYPSPEYARTHFQKRMCPQSRYAAAIDILRCKREDAAECGNLSDESEEEPDPLWTPEVGEQHMKAIAKTQSTFQQFVQRMSTVAASVINQVIVSLSSKRPAAKAPREVPGGGGCCCGAGC